MYRKLRKTFIDKNEKDTLLAAIVFLIGITMVCNAPLILYFNLTDFSFQDWRSIYFLLLSINFAILGTVTLISGLCLWKPRKTSGGKKKIGIIAIATGILLIIITIIYAIVNFLYMESYMGGLWTNFIVSLPQHALFVIPGIFLIIHGIFLIKYENA